MRGYDPDVSAEALELPFLIQPNMPLPIAATMMAAKIFVPNAAE
jgi:hypothetical protein